MIGRKDENRRERSAFSWKPALWCCLMAVLVLACGRKAAAAGSSRSRGRTAAVSGAVSTSSGKSAAEKGTAGTSSGQTSRSDGEDAAQIKVIRGDRKTVFIGDSRTVGGYNAVSGSTVTEQVNAEDPAGDLWSARTSQGLDWMKRKGVPQVEDQIDAATDVVVCCGVNDEYRTDFVDSYVSYLNQKAAEWSEKGAVTYFVSILPVKKNDGKLTNRRIRSNNQALISGFSSEVVYIDLDTPFRNNLLYEDNLHFQPATCEMLYQYIKLTLAAENGSWGYQ